MRVFRVRKKLELQGLLLLQHGNGFKVTNNGTAKTLMEEEFPNLHEVEMWLKKTFTNRLTEAECDEWDKDWAKFVMKHGDYVGCDRV